MKRYLTRRPRSADYDKGPDAETYLARTVYEHDSTPFETGLLDAFGDPLCAAYEMDQIGFIRRK
jgi:hypothetical protein